MTYKSPYGEPEGLRDRLAEWAQRLGQDKALPWAGLGLIADLEAAVREFDAVGGRALDPSAPQPQEYDL